MANNLTKRLNDLAKVIKRNSEVDIVRFVKPDDEKFLVECSNLKSEIGRHLTMSDLDQFENSLTFIENITE